MNSSSSRGNALLRLRRFSAPAIYAGKLLIVAFISAMATAFGYTECRTPQSALYSDGRLLTVDTYSQANADSANLIGKAFSKLMLLQTSNKDILGQMEGPEGSGRPITLKTDLSKQGADTVFFSTMNRPGGEGATGENLLEAEDLDFASYKVQIDFFRHGLGSTAKLIKFLAAGQSLEAKYADQESDYFALKRQNDMYMLWRQQATAQNTMRPNDRATNDLLLSTDVYSTTFISDLASRLKTLGAPPAKVNKVKVAGFKADILSYIMLGSDRMLNPLKSNSSYIQSLQQADERGERNMIWTGQYARWDGQYIMHHDVVHEDTRGALGAAIEPEAILGTALTNGSVTDATTISITGGGYNTVNTSYLPLKWFAGYPFTTVGGTTPSADSGTYYVVIYNVSGSDVGKFGLYQYTGSNNVGNAITCSNFLGATASGTRLTTLAGVTWNAAVNTTSHPTGSRVIQVNAKCVPYCYGISMGANAGLRAYGGPAIKPIHEVADWFFKKGLGFLALYGQGVPVDVLGNIRNYILTVAAYRPQGCGNLPVVTS